MRRTRSAWQIGRSAIIRMPCPAIVVAARARSIPIVGELFKQVLDKASRRELIVLITPRVVRHSSQLENITRQLRGAMRIRE